MSFLNGIGAGLATMGQGIASFAQAAGIQAQKAQLQQQAMRLADQLTTAREVNVEQPFTAQQSALQRQSTETVANISGGYELRGAQARAGAEVAAAQAEAGAQIQSANIQANALPPDVRSAIAISKAPPEVQRTYFGMHALQGGIPPDLLGPVFNQSDDTSGTPAPSGGNANGTSGSNSTTGGPTPPPNQSLLNGGSDKGQQDSQSSSTSGSTSGTTQPNAENAAGDAFASPPAGYNEKALQGLSPGLQAQVKAIALGRMAPLNTGGRNGLINQDIMQHVLAYDPGWDGTRFTIRQDTIKDFTTGQAAQNIVALNTAVGHAGVVSQALTELSNGMFPSTNAAWNWVAEHTGTPNITSAKEAVSALASEARKVFASGRGGGNLVELENWENNFPINGSPAQQQAAMREFTHLMGGRMDALATQYDRGTGEQLTGAHFLTPDALHTYQRLAQPGQSGETAPATGVQPIGGTKAAPRSPAGTSWQYGATLGDGSKAYSNDGQSWFDAAGKPLGPSVTTNQ